MSKLSVCVYCGARKGARASYTEAAEVLGQGLAARNWRLVYGAGDVGLMGTVARAAQEAGGDTFGVIPAHLVAMEVGKADLSTYVVTETMHERKKVMLMNADAVVLLPGGAGSLDEFFEALTWRQLGLHDKPIFAIDTDGYWTPLMRLLTHVVDEGFADASLFDLMQVVPDPGAALDAIADHGGT
ncbi:TIGR00730 family Rossman fold protein [uncultured Tateyamaria sp.]|uniref:LOG family protein n=1 Tax=Tateyamaria sp. 1078 TaxID=3417464 RepID=UPI00261FA967|nr:TIGR00730 family Rossman fold protein [uncultured Tateyamaria sp.]